MPPLTYGQFARMRRLRDRYNPQLDELPPDEMPIDPTALPPPPIDSEASRLRQMRDDSMRTGGGRTFRDLVRHRDDFRDVDENGVPRFPNPAERDWFARGGVGPLDTMQAREAATTPTARELSRPEAGLRQYYGGFEFGKDYDLGKSAKGTFFYATAPGAADLRWQKKETAEDWFNQYARPDLEARGYQILELKGDRIKIKTSEGTHWVDWVENIDSDPAKGEKPPRLAWQAQTESGGWLHGGPGGGLAPEADPRVLQRPPDQYGPMDKGLQPVIGDDGMVTFRVTPEAYRRLAASQLPTGAVPRRRRRTATDFLEPMPLGSEMY